MTLCRIVVGVLIALWLIALGILAIGTFGWFGQERDPLAGVYLVLLGQPWIGLVGELSEPLGPWLGALMPLINIVLLASLCRVFSRRQQETK